ncbi:hypothetical protein MVEN_00682100 [Mycena venus]|uniref:Uncharacterized protein n=1 Tax=Mycena venus TaxID=2733690 RepID=A0A8H6YJT8_9AGAR|nr:hypothetical protein MVEN_00682100 [Mycena venus]
MPPVAVARISELPALPILKKNLSGRSNPVHTPFSEFVDCTVAAELYTTYDESMSAKSLAAQQDHCGSGPQSYDPADFPPDILWAPAPEVVTPSATSGYRKLAEPLADWVAGYVWTACSTGFSLPSAFSQSLTIVKQRSRSPPSHLANAVHSLLLSTVLQPSAVFFGRLEARFRAVLLGNGLDQDVMEASAPFRLIVLGFMLANKWLDVHTFSNKIWHTISNVPIATLNKLESLTLDIFAYNLSVPSSDWRQWLSHLVSYHQLYSPLHLQPISRPSTNPRPIVLLALNEIIQATAACNFNSACPQPVFIGIGGRRRERMEKEQARSVDVLEIDSDEDGPLREEYMPKRRIRCAGRKASEYARIKDLHQISVRLFEKHSIPLGTTNNGAPLQEVSMNNVLPPFYPEPSSGGGNLHRGSFGAPTQPPNKRSFLGLPNWGGPSSDFLTLDTDVSLWRSNSEVFQHRKASFGPGSAEHGSGSRTSQQLRPYPSPNVSTYMHSRDGSSLFASSPQGVNNGDMYAIIHRLDRLFQDKKGSYVKFLARCGASAQRLLDVLQDLLDYDSKFATMNKRRLFKALIRLSG